MFGDSAGSSGLKRILCGLLGSLCVISVVIGQDRPAPALIGYYAGDGKGLDRYPIERLTHLIWCFAHLDGDRMVLSRANEGAERAQEELIHTMVGFKQRNPKVKVLVSLGGWGGCATCSAVFGREEGRRTFALSVLGWMERLGVDGIDLDWEYPAVPGPPGHAYAPADRHAFTLLVRELRQALGSKYEISFAAGGTDECLLKGFEWPLVMPVVDRVHVMSYDLVHGFSTTTGHHTPLFSGPPQVLSADHAVHLLDSLAVPREKVVIGAAFYARIWKDVPAANNGLFQPGTFSRTISYSALDTTITEARGWHWFRDKEAWACYAYSPETREFLTTDDPSSIAAKARYVRSEGLGGIMFWQIADDRPVHGLLEVMYEALRSP